MGIIEKGRDSGRRGTNEARRRRRLGHNSRALPLIRGEVIGRLEPALCASRSCNSRTNNVHARSGSPFSARGGSLVRTFVQKSAALMKRISFPPLFLFFTRRASSWAWPNREQIRFRNDSRFELFPSRSLQITFNRKEESFYFNIRDPTEKFLSRSLKREKRFRPPVHDSHPPSHPLLLTLESSPWRRNERGN